MKTWNDWKQELLRIEDEIAAYLRVNVDTEGYGFDGPEYKRLCRKSDAICYTMNALEK